MAGELLEESHAITLLWFAVDGEVAFCGLRGRNIRTQQAERQEREEQLLEDAHDCALY